MNEQILIGITSILVLGILAQWLAWRFALPSILPLLVFGFIAGPITGILDPDKSFGSVLFPLVSVSVAIILFEGGANLKLSEVKSVRGVVRNLITTGILVTWILSSAAAYLILQFPFYLSLLFGAILVVTGPTVILPILRHVRPMGQIKAVLKWEGIINDPIGALLAILVFEVIIAGGIGEAAQHVISSILKTILLSSTFGVAGAFIMVQLLKKKLIPEFLQNPLSIALIILAYTASNIIQKESGLFAVTIMGIIIVNQKKVSVQHLIEFKEILRTILLAFLFMVLAARIELNSFRNIGWESFIFIVILIFIIRPAAVWFSTIKSSLTRQELIYLSFIAPRGVVAAAVASVFSIELINAGYPNAEILVPVMFLVIISTITFYGLISMPLAKILKIADADPQGLLILGAHPFARSAAKILQKHSIKVLLVDTNPDNIEAAKREDLPVHSGSILAEGILDDLDLTGIGKFLALTQNKEVNSLAVLYFSKVFAPSEVYQIIVEDDSGKRNDVTRELQGQILFNSNITYSVIGENFEEQNIISSSFSDKFTYEDFKNSSKDNQISHLFLITENKKLLVYTNEQARKPRTGQVLISFLQKD